MLKNHLKIAFRNIQKQKFYASINILGLSIGIAASLLIIVYILDEFSYDQFHTKADNIYRVTLKAKLSGQDIEGATSCAPLAATAVDEFPEITEASRLKIWTNVIVTHKEKTFTEKSFLLADSSFFSVFSFDLLQGNKATVLQGPDKIVLTASAAKKYFGYEGPGDESPIGKLMQIGNETHTCEVSGIVSDPPSNSHFDFDMIMSMESWDYSKNTQWTSNSFYTYIVLDPRANWKQVENKLGDLVEKYVGPEIEQYLGFSLQHFRDQGGLYGYHLQPLTDIHLKSKIDDELGTNGDITYLYIFSIIAFFIIVIACINFMNLSTARSSNRAKEVGVRKAVGAHRSGLINQFLTESIVFSFISTLLALALIFLLLPSFNSIAGKSIAFSLVLQPKIVLGLLAIIAIIGVLAGSYPSLYLTSFKPAEVLKGKIRAGFKSSGIRNMLVIFQFTISIGLIVSTLIVYKQINMMQSRNLGFDKENVLIIDNGSKLGSNMESFKNQLKSYEQIVSVSSSSLLPPQIDNNSVFRPLGKNQQDQLLFFYHADYDHLETLGFELKAGRFFSKDFPSDSTAILLNETAMKVIGWDNHESKQLLSFFDEGDDNRVNVVGVVKDFNFESLKSRIRPLAILPGTGNLISVRIGPGDLQESIDLIEETWKKLAVDSPFEYAFLDENLNSLYRSEQRLSKIFVIFTSLAVIIACLGLFGLATFTAEQKSKEIGIRKVLGASSLNLVILMSKDFTKLIVISILLAIPLAYWFTSSWLDSFAYKVEIGYISFIVAGLLSITIAWITVSYQSFKAAATNPVNSLKAE